VLAHADVDEGEDLTSVRDLRRAGPSPPTAIRARGGISNRCGVYRK
jgi:hypothetical protein